MNGETLNEREQLILEAVIRTFVETAEPAGSRTLTRRFGLGLSPATVRNTMSDLEEKGYLTHPHTSAGRVPTDRAYRLYVNMLLHQPRGVPAEERALRAKLEEAAGDRSAVEQLVRHAVQALGLVTQELGIAMSPSLDEASLERMELIPLSEGKLLLVLALRAGGVRTVYVDVPLRVPAGSLVTVEHLLNERLAGLPLSEIRATFCERLRDSVPAGDAPAQELLNVFLQFADGWFDAPPADTVHLGRTSVLAEQPEFHSGQRLRSLIELTEQRELLNRLLRERLGGSGLTITIGGEHGSPALADLTVVTSEYRVGRLKGVIGVIGPTRMPYERVLALVESTSLLVSEFLA